MGRTYSLSGFLNAALRRSSKTVLVEGPTDKHVLHRIELERFPTKAGASAIDHAGMLDDPALAKMGNREKVLAVQAKAAALAGTAPKLAFVLATLTDREWDGLTFANAVPHPEWAPPAQGQNGFITLGHSLENYHFDVDCAVEYLKFTYPEHINAGLVADLHSYFGAILVFAAVLSLRIRDDACIGRCTGLLEPSHIELRNNRMYLATSYGAACATRAIATSTSIVSSTNATIDAAWAGLSDKPFTKWLPHGHLGDEILWCATAKLALLSGVPADVAAEIARGHKKERERFKAQWLSKVAPATRLPLDSAIEWLHTQVSTTAR